MTLAVLPTQAIGSGRVRSGASASAGTATVTSTAPAMTCADVAELDIGGIQEAPTRIASATAPTAEHNALGDWSVCEVKGFVAPQIQLRCGRLGQRESPPAGAPRTVARPDQLGEEPL